MASFCQIRLAWGQSRRARAIARSRKSVRAGPHAAALLDGREILLPQLHQQRRIDFAAKIEVGNGGEALGHLGRHGPAHRRDRACRCSASRLLGRRDACSLAGETPATAARNTSASTMRPFGPRAFDVRGVDAALPHGSPGAGRSWDSWIRLHGVMVPSCGPTGRRPPCRPRFPRARRRRAIRSDVTALSVSISSNASPLPTRSPIFLNQPTIVASVIIRSMFGMMTGTPPTTADVAGSWPRSAGWRCAPAPRRADVARTAVLRPPAGAARACRRRRDGLRRESGGATLMRRTPFDHRLGRRHDLLGAGRDRVFQDRGERMRDRLGVQPADRGIQFVERFFHDDRRRSRPRCRTSRRPRRPPTAGRSSSRSPGSWPTSSGTIVRRSITSAEIPWAANCSAAATDRCNQRPQETIVRSVP